jgi:hypothetical protein
MKVNETNYYATFKIKSSLYDLIKLPVVPATPIFWPPNSLLHTADGKSASYRAWHRMKLRATNCLMRNALLEAGKV